MSLKSLRGPTKEASRISIYLQKELFAQLAELKRLESWSFLNRMNAWWLINVCLPCWSFSTVSMHGGSSMSPSHVALKRGAKHEREIHATSTISTFSSCLLFLIVVDDVDEKKHKRTDAKPFLNS
jgi:hypothetical protein